MQIGKEFSDFSLQAWRDDEWQQVDFLCEYTLDEALALASAFVGCAENNENLWRLMRRTESGWEIVA